MRSTFAAVDRTSIVLDAGDYGVDLDPNTVNQDTDGTWLVNGTWWYDFLHGVIAAFDEGGAA